MGFPYCSSISIVIAEFNSYKLEIMCEHLGVELDDAHDADADVSATTNVAAVLTQRMRSIGGEYTGDVHHLTEEAFVKTYVLTDNERLHILRTFWGVGHNELGL